MPAVRHVQEPPIRRDGDFGSGVPIGLAFRQCSDNFHFLDPSVIPAICRDRRIKFVVHVEHRQRWVKDAVPRRCTGSRWHRLVQRQLAVLEAEDEGAVEAFVGHDDEPPRRIKDHCVRMRRTLLRRIWTWLAGEFKHLRYRLQRAVLGQRQHGDIAAGVIRHNQKAVGRVQRRIDRIGSAARLSIQQPQMPAGSIDAECTDMGEPAMHRI